MRRDPVDLRRALATIAGQQAGFFTAAQALSVGYSYPSQLYHRRSGDWIRVDRGIYRLTTWPESPTGDLVRWTLWTRGSAVVSGETALALHEIGDLMPARVHLSVPPGFRGQAPGVILHHGLPLDTDIEEREGFRVTTPERSILDVAGHVDGDHLARIIAEAVDRGATSATRLRDRADEFGAPAALAIERALGQAGR